MTFISNFHTISECRFEEDNVVAISDQNHAETEFSYWGKQFLISFEITVKKFDRSKPSLNVIQMISETDKNVPKFYVNTVDGKFYAEFEGDDDSRTQISKEMDLEKTYKIEISQHQNQDNKAFEFCLKVDDNDPECKVNSNVKELHGVKAFLAHSDALTSDLGTVSYLAIANQECFHGTKYGTLNKIFYIIPLLISDCDCDINGSRNAYCDAVGQCNCKAGFTGKSCESCTDEHRTPPNCDTGKTLLISLQ